ncbi:hypothetical protein EVAR_50499_1 [Eumeta japonica]|uniref:Uncharacterized protein n=1 Tax=Eumeta variegata TaxID=151549 RepID=A0A4C1ZXP6_EUMVA|nr:hypothetical protein EVAR_50499_1 [Eumeta japonica]
MKPRRAGTLGLQEAYNKIIGHYMRKCNRNGQNISLVEPITLKEEGISSGNLGLVVEECDVHGPLTSLRPRWATGPQETDWHLDAPYLLGKGATVEGVDVNFVGGRDGWDSIRCLVKKNNTSVS